VAIHIVSSRAPLPAKKGDQIVLSKRLEAIRDRHDVTVYIISASDEEIERATVAFPNLKFVRLVRNFSDFLSGFLYSIIHGFPLHYAIFWNRSMNQVIQRLGSTDKVCFVLERTCCYDLNPKCSYFLEGIDFTYQNFMLRAQASNFWKSVFYRFEARRVLRSFSRMVKRFDTISFVSRYDLIDAGVSVPENVVVTPNGVPESHLPPRSFSSLEPTFCFHGNFNYLPNLKVLDALGYIWPKITENIPCAKLTIFGRHLDPNHPVFKLGGVQCLFEVDDVMHVLRAQNFYLCPMNFGTGIQNKLLEAIACENILIASDKVIRPFEVDNFQYISLDNPNWVKVVESILLSNDHLYREKDNAAKVLDKLTWTNSNSEFLSWVEREVGE